MEVGPLARVLMLYASGHEQTQALVNSTLQTLDVPVEALFSTLGRTAARTLETKVVADYLQTWLDNLIGNIRNGDTQYLQRNALGSVRLARPRPGAPASWKRLAADWHTGS